MFKISLLTITSIFRVITVVFLATCASTLAFVSFMNNVIYFYVTYLYVYPNILIACGVINYLSRQFGESHIQFVLRPNTCVNTSIISQGTYAANTTQYMVYRAINVKAPTTAILLKSDEYHFSITHLECTSGLGLNGESRLTSIFLELELNLSEVPL